MKLDKLDGRILHWLNMDSRMSARKIAREIGRSKETVNYRIRRLREKNIVKNFYTFINYSHLGYDYYLVFIKLYGCSHSIEKKILDFLGKNPKCVNARLIDGEYGIVFVFMARNPKCMWDFLDVLYGNFKDYIVHDSSHTVLDTYKMFRMFHPGENAKMNSFSHYNISGFEADMIDEKILEAISNNARMSIAEISNKLGEPGQKIAYRIGRLEESGIISFYSCEMNYGLLGMESIIFCVSLKDFKSFDKMLYFFDSTNAAIYAYKLLGAYDLVVEVSAPNPSSFRDILSEFKQQFSGVYSDYQTHRVIQKHPLYGPQTCD